MACVSITDYLTRESGRFLENEINQRVFGTSLWMNLTRRGVHPSGLSETLNTLTVERTAPYEADPTWTQVQVQDGAEGGACLPPTTNLEIGSTTRSFNLFKRVLEGPDFCAEEFRTVFALADRLNRISRSLSNQVQLEWEMRDRNEYFRLSKTKVIVDGTQSTDETMAADWDTVATNTGATCPTSQMTQGILDKYRMKLIRDGATPVAFGSTGRPILGFVADAETLDGIIRNNADIRDDFRWARPMENLSALGVSREYRGYMHLEDLYPNRYECSGGTYTKQATFTQSDATKGKKAEINTAWETATYTESFIHSPDVFEQLVPQPIVAPSPNFRFDPVNYTGAIDVMNIRDRKCNPKGTIIYHRMELAASSKPEMPEHGVAFIHLRCDPDPQLITSCPS